MPSFSGAWPHFHDLEQLYWFYVRHELFVKNVEEFREAQTKKYGEDFHKDRQTNHPTRIASDEEIEENIKEYRKSKGFKD